VVTMDFKLPDRDGDEVVAEIRAEFPEARIVLLSIFENSESIWRATQAGVLGYVSKGAKVAEVIKAIRSIAVGKPYFSSGLEEKLAARREQENLTPRELAVLELVATGHSNKEIVAALHVSLSTVKLHLQNWARRTEPKPPRPPFNEASCGSTSEPCRTSGCAAPSTHCKR